MSKIPDMVYDACGDSLVVEIDGPFGTFFWHAAYRHGVPSEVQWSSWLHSCYFWQGFLGVKAEPEPFPPKDWS